jgi:hypothetical protein
MANKSALLWLTPIVALSFGIGHAMGEDNSSDSGRQAANGEEVPRVPPGYFPRVAFTSIEEVLNSAPDDALQKLQNAGTAAEGAAELNEYFGHEIVGRIAVLRAEVAFAEATPDGRNKFRVLVTNVPVKWKDGAIDRLVWFYFPQANVPAKDQVPIGALVNVSGVIRRCEIVTVNGALRINFDLTQSKVEAP